MNNFIFENWHGWFGTKVYLLSDESTKTLRQFKTVDDCINWFFLGGHKDAARALNKVKTI